MRFWPFGLPGYQSSLNHSRLFQTLPVVGLEKAPIVLTIVELRNRNEDCGSGSVPTGAGTAPSTSGSTSVAVASAVSVILLRPRFVR